MKTTKIITIITSLLVLVTITVVGIVSGNTNLLIAPGLAVIVALFNAKHIFEDPDAITELKGSHAEKVRTLEHQQADMKAGFEKLLEQMEAHFAQELAKKDADVQASSISAIKEKTKRIEAERQLDIYKPRPSRPDGRDIAPGYTVNSGGRPPNPSPE